MELKEVKIQMALAKPVIYKNAQCIIKELILWHDGKEFKYSANLQEVANKNVNYRVNIKDISIDKNINTV
mgnify:FL=1